MLDEPHTGRQQLEDDLLKEIETLVQSRQSSGRVLLARLIGAKGLEQSGSGSVVVDHRGREFIDAGSFSVFLLGHSRREVLAAITSQLGTLSGSTKLMLNEVNARATSELVEFAGSGFDRAMLLNSGCESVDAALKLARAATGRTAIAHLTKSFHGKSVGALSVTDSDVFRAPFGELLTDVHAIKRNDLDDLHTVLNRERPACLILEPIQGEGGIVALSDRFMQEARKVCTEKGTLLICDEIQCGLGRCGRRFQFRKSGIAPDMVLVGKALGAGIIPVSALLAAETAFMPYAKDPFLHTSTFGGNPVASAAARAVLGQIVSEDVPSRAKRLGDQLSKILGRLHRQFPQLISDTRGEGLLQGIQFVRADLSAEFLKACLKEGVLVSPCLTTPDVVRVTPAATMTEDALADLGQRFQTSLQNIEVCV